MILLGFKNGRAGRMALFVYARWGLRRSADAAGVRGLRTGGRRRGYRTKATVKATAEFIHEAGGEFILPVEENRKALFDVLDALPWHQVPIAHSATDRDHGRITTRTIQVLPAPEDLPFPHVNQVLLIERYVSDLAGNPVSAVAALGVASPAPDRAKRRRPGPPCARALGD